MVKFSCYLHGRQLREIMEKISHDLQLMDQHQQKIRSISNPSHRG